MAVLTCQMAIWEGGRAGGQKRKDPDLEGGMSVVHSPRGTVTGLYPSSKATGLRLLLIDRIRRGGFHNRGSFWGLWMLDTSCHWDTFPTVKYGPWGSRFHTAQGEGQTHHRFRSGEPQTQGWAEPCGAQAILWTLFSSTPTAGSPLDLHHICHRGFGVHAL